MKKTLHFFRSAVLLTAALALSLTACGAPTLTTQAPEASPVTVPTPPAPPSPEPTPAPAPAPEPAPASPLTVLDSAEVTVTLHGDTLTIALSPGVQGAWFRLLVDGQLSRATGDYVGLSGSMPLLNFAVIPGLEVQTSPATAGPWTTVARTQ